MNNSGTTGGFNGKIWIVDFPASHVWFRGGCMWPMWPTFFSTILWVHRPYRAYRCRCHGAPQGRSVRTTARAGGEQRHHQSGETLGQAGGAGHGGIPRETQRMFVSCVWAGFYGFLRAEFGVHESSEMVGLIGFSWFAHGFFSNHTLFCL